jgi:hypothetical protein
MFLHPSVTTPVSSLPLSYTTVSFGNALVGLEIVPTAVSQSCGERESIVKTLSFSIAISK